MRYPEAIWQPGPAWKVWPERNAIAGVIEHSMEGEEEGAWSQLNGSAEVSWHFSVMYDGAVFQHYELDASPWHAGSKARNVTLIGVEHEGRKGEPLTPAQVKSSVALTRWVARQGGWRMERHKTLFEHNEVSSTSCPNGRIPWSAYEEEELAGLRQPNQSEALQLAEDLKHYGYMVNDPAEKDGYNAQVADAPPGVKRRWVIDVKED